MGKVWAILIDLPADRTGQTTVEYSLLLAIFGLPMFYVMAKLLEILAEYYKVVSFVETLPYP